MRQKQRVFSLFLLSPSSWRAWIEISIKNLYMGEVEVALLMEGVDRNWQAPHRKPLRPGRPPHGGRG